MIRHRGLNCFHPFFALQRLIVEFGNHLVQQGRMQRIRTGVDLCLMMGLLIIFNQDTYRSTSRWFCCDRSVVSYHYKIVIEGLREMAPRYIKWPSRIERHSSARRFEARFGLAGAFAAIDCSLFLITKPAVQPQRYVRDKKYSVKVQFCLIIVNWCETCMWGSQGVFMMSAYSGEVPLPTICTAEMI